MFLNFFYQKLRYPLLLMPVQWFEGRIIVGETQMFCCIPSRTSLKHWQFLTVWTAYIFKISSELDSSADILGWRRLGWHCHRLLLLPGKNGVFDAGRMRSGWTGAGRSRHFMRNINDHLQSQMSHWHVTDWRTAGNAIQIIIWKFTLVGAQNFNNFSIGGICWVYTVQRIHLIINSIVGGSWRNLMHAKQAP